MSSLAEAYEDTTETPDDVSRALLAISIQEMQDIEDRERIVFHGAVGRVRRVLVGRGVQLRTRGYGSANDKVVIDTAGSSPPDAAVYPGQAATKDVLRHEGERETLIALIKSFASVGFSSNMDQPLSRISEATMKAAKSLIEALPPKAVLPRIAPDGEGALMLLFGSGASEALLVVDGWKLHLVEAPATPNAAYLDDLPFDGEVLPEQVRRAIPTSQ